MALLRILLLSLLLIFVLFALPIEQLHHFTMMPGDIGDARLNNYFLENIYQFFAGNSESLWHLGFFWPFPYVLGFSDNLFGSAPVYLIARLFTGQSDTAFQIWFMFAYVVNFSAAYYSLRRLGRSQMASTVGALIFAFALPTTAQAGHAQLHYRFGVPLATTFFVLFLQRKEYRLLAIAGAWLVWQFYCGIYMGFFTLLLLVAATAVHFLYTKYSLKCSFILLLNEFISPWKAQSKKDKIKFLIILMALFGAILWLFYPYLQVSNIYGAKRTWGEISTMLPRPQSYFLSDASYFWSIPTARIFSNIPMRHEHQMFIGFVPMFLSVLGFLLGSRKKNGHVFILMSGMLGVVILSTLYINGFSLWYLVHNLPLCSAIRAMSRLDQVLLFPVAYLVCICIDDLRTNHQCVNKFVIVIIVPLLIVEFSATTMYVSSKKEWRERLAIKESVIPKHLAKDSILFFSQNKGPWFADEIDAMWVSLNHGVKTLNGYSGLFPPGYSPEYNKDCVELPKRVLSYLSFIGKNGETNKYLELMNCIVPIGFEDCVPGWRTNPPSITKIDREYSADEIRNLTYKFESIMQVNGKSMVKFTIINNGQAPIAALSSIGKPMRISWRFLAVNGEPVTGWDTRKDIPFDIPANGELTMQIPIKPESEIKGGTLQISIVQEGVFWGHDVGVEPLSIPWE
ncbi:hypothetical protein BuS5_03721 [Desulfosarcina sp. BuS5]|uniref:hypothetical protein n=1 Tax=Desulfosarcina sp. BuS5 TaxID=933262 RepID=UPI0004897AFE|nr:hypothetical protein [Desulfosarcina sp. BuS5]WDN90750.1 hypothetical protein BuS5_03721 [Desulfosarcina sp. BuS5]